MQNYKEQIEEYLDNYIKKLLLVDESNLLEYFLAGEKIIFSNKKFTIDAWMENVDKNKLFIIEIQQKLFLGKRVFSRGMLITKDKRKFMTDKELWNIGLG